MRERFLTHIKDTVESMGFAIETSEIYEGLYKFNRSIEQPGQTIVINGRVSNTPPTILNVSYHIYIIGDGYIENADGSDHKDFTQVNFSIFVDNNLQAVMEEGFYWDDIHYFDKILRSFFK